jgi:hypothetical protein
MTNEELTAIENRANAATREPWIVERTYVPTASLSAVSEYGMGMEVAECQIDADGAFIAAARVDVPALIAEVRRLRDERDALRKALWLCDRTCDFIAHSELERHGLGEKCPVEARITAALSEAP